jgi:AcrR family transcriptional regulator
MSLFLELGFEAASMEAIAERAGVSKGTLYARFAGKEDLLRLLVEERIAALSALAGQQDDQLTDDLEQRLRHHARLIITAMRWPAVTELERLLDGTARAIPEMSQSFNRIGVEFPMKLLMDEIERGTANDASPAADPTAIAQTLLGALVGWTRTEAMVRPVTDADARAYADKVVTLLLAGRSAW